MSTKTDELDVMERVAKARTVLAGNATATEHAGRVTTESLDAARAAGAFAVTTPRRFGGLEADNRTMVRMFAELGAGCTSTSWLAAVSATAKSMFTNWMGPEAQEALYADPDAWLCGTAMPAGRARTVPGGARISGTWGYASGCLDAPWAMVGAGVVDDEQRQGPFLVLLPTSELGVEHTWDGVAGLRGTGSHTLTADDVFVPSAFVLAPPANPAVGNALLQVQLHTLSPLLGAAKGALEFVDPIMTADRPIFATPYRRRVESPLARGWFAEAAHLVDSAGQRLLRVADVLDGVAPDSGPLLRAGLMAALAESRMALEKLVDLHGSSAFAENNPVGRYWRDFAVGSRHGAINPWTAADAYHRALFETP